MGVLIKKTKQSLHSRENLSPGARTSRPQTPDPFAVKGSQSHFLSQWAVVNRETHDCSRRSLTHRWDIHTNAQGTSWKRRWKERMSQRLGNAGCGHDMAASRNRLIATVLPTQGLYKIKPGKATHTPLKE